MFFDKRHLLKARIQENKGTFVDFNVRKHSN